MGELHAEHIDLAIIGIAEEVNAADGMSRDDSYFFLGPSCFLPKGAEARQQEEKRALDDKKRKNPQTTAASETR